MNLKQLKKNFKNKKVFITGNTGFVGSYLSLTLSLMNSKRITFLCVHKKNKKNKTIGVIHIHNILENNIQ